MRRTLVFLAFLGGVIPFQSKTNSRGQVHAEGHGSSKQGSKVYLAGDVILGGLFPVHENSKDKGLSCGQKTYKRGIERLEAMLYAVDTINRDQDLLKDISLGVNILDTCGRDTYALNQSLEFIRSSLSSSTFDVSQYECSNGGGTPRLKFNNTGHILGVIGGSYSSVSIQVANLLRLFRIPQISPASTAKALSDKTRFEMFARTVPPDTFQAIALVDIVKKFNWTYVSTIASEGSYGESGIDVFQREAEKRNICIAIAEKVPSNADDTKFKEVVTNLMKKPQAKGVVLFTRAEDARGILRAAKKLQENDQVSNKTTHKFYWLASDGWGKQSQVVRGIEDFAVGAITVELESKKIPKFDDYLRRLTPEKNERNLWFRDYWEDLFDCDVDQRSYSYRDSNLKKRRKLCNPKLRISSIPKYESDSKVQFVIDAVYAFAHALDALKKDICPRYKGVCDAMTWYDGGEFYKKYLLKVDFNDMANSSVKFDENGDGIPRYTIYNYQKRQTDNGTHYKIIGKWQNTLEMDERQVMWSSEVTISTTSTSSTSTTVSSSESASETIWETSVSPNSITEVTAAIIPTLQIPRSTCSEPCKIGQIMLMNTGETCCWVCDDCKPWEFMLDKFSCEECELGFWPDTNFTGCYELPLQYMKWDTVFAIVPVCIASLGVLFTLTSVGIFIKYADTPLVRASGRELSYVILGGLLLCFLNTFILLAKPGIVICGLQRFSVGMGFCAVYGALLTKTNRISRIFHSASQSARRPSYISPRSQLIITAVLVSVQFLATLLWLVASIPAPEKVYPVPRTQEVILKCNVNDSSFVISQVYNMVLISICTYYAVLTRKVPENFNEAKFIGFTMYTTCIIWLAFVPIYFGTGNSFEIQITTLCISISLSAYTTLFCLFAPKLYIIVFQPEKNVRKLTMNSVGQKKTTTSLVSTAAAVVAANNLSGGLTGGQSVNHSVVAPSTSIPVTSVVCQTKAQVLGSGGINTQGSTILRTNSNAPAGNTAPPKGPTNSNAAANPSPRPSVGPPQTSSSSQKQSSSVEDSKQPPNPTHLQTSLATTAVTSSSTTSLRKTGISKSVDPTPSQVIIESKAPPEAKSENGNHCKVNIEPRHPDDNEGSEDHTMIVDETKTLLQDQSRPKRISFSKLSPVVTPEDNGGSLTGTMGLKSSIISREVCTTTTLEEGSGDGGDDNSHRATSLEDVPQSPGTPCSQCMREKAESQNRQFSGMNANNGLASPLGQNGGQEFFGSSEECCSMGSCCNNSCCNNSCGGSCMDSQTPLAKVGNGGGVTEAAVTSEVNVHKRTFHTASLGKLNQHSKDRGLDLSTTMVSTISGPEFESKRLSQISRSVPEDLPGELDGSRHLVTFITPSMETIPLEMCQDIPDVLI